MVHWLIGLRVPDAPGRTDGVRHVQSRRQLGQSGL